MADPLTAPIPDPELEKLEAMAAEHDVQASQELSAPEPEAAQPAAEKEEPKAEDKPDNSEVETEKPERPRDALGRFTKTEDGKDIPESERQPAEKPADQQTSDYEAKRQEKARKEAERLDKTWQNVDLRKQELERREREIAQREQAVLQRPQQQRLTTEDGEPITSRSLFNAANDFRKRAKKALADGDFDAANENIGLAEEAEQHAQQFYQVEAKEAQQAQIQQYSQVWNGHMQKAIEADADLIKPDSPLAKQMQSLLETHGQVFWMIPDGFPKAVEIAKLRLEAGSASELRTKLTEAEKEVERLTKATTPLGAGPPPQIQHKNFDSLTIDEQMAELERRAAQADREALSTA
jgi:hypothetical protein